MLYRAFSPVGPPAEAAADLQSGRSKREFSEDVNSARRSHRTPEPVASAADYSQMQRVVTELLEPMAARDHLSATDLHEVYLRLAKAQPSLVGDPAEFAPMFAKVIRRLLIDLARARRDAGLSLDRTAARTATDIGAQDHLLAVDQALERLAQASPLQARIVELRFFAGLSEEEIATVLGLPARTVRRDARIAMVQMHALMTDVSS
ncbi:MAG: sigma-70 family RNA polymerase sigma factor [Bryobacteraceae bacterium]